MTNPIMILKKNILKKRQKRNIANPKYRFLLLNDLKKILTNIL
jgi:hypothetical protein